MRTEISSLGIKLRSFAVGNHKTTCPKCSATRSNKSDPCLSVTIEADSFAFNCHHCGWKGGRKAPGSLKVEERRITVPKYDPAAHELAEHHAKWLTETRGLDLAYVTRQQVKTTRAWMPGTNREEEVIAFPYTREGKVVNVKYRTVDKQFRQEKDAEKIFFGIDLCDPRSKTLVITEGEIDVLALNSAGVRNAVSVPDGAPRQVADNTPPPEQDRKFEYVWNCIKFLGAFDKIILATDADGPGQALAEELSRRIGKVKCWRVEYPEGCKDANDVLLKHGKEVLKQLLADAQPYPLAGVFKVKDFYEDVYALLSGAENLKGLSTGWQKVDRLMTIREGMLSVVTGIPSSGKSQFVDALMLNMMTEHGWAFGVCSFENPPELHIVKLLHASMGHVPGVFNDAAQDKTLKAMGELNDMLHLIRPGDDTPTIDWILERAKELVQRHGIRGLIIDPYNEVAQDRGRNESETDFISRMLGKVKRFAQVHGVHVWFIAHPAKGGFSEGEKPRAPTLYDISGSAHWVNKADIGFVVHREWNDDGTRSNKCTVKVMKVRHSWLGAPGKTELWFSSQTGRYHENERLDYVGV